MPRLAFEEPKGGPLAKAAREATQQQEPAEQLEELFTEEEQDVRPRRQPSRDTVLVILKAATVAVVLALAGLVVLLATAGGDEPTAKSPGVPEIETSDTPGSDPNTPAGGGIVAPEVRSQTTEFSVTPPPVTQSTPPTVEDPPDPRFVRVGELCDTRGAYAFTESYEPVVCAPRGRDDQLAWRRMFR